MRKFKVGDRIKRVNNPAHWAPLGFITTVIEGYKYVDIHKSTLNTGIVDSQWELVSPVEEAKQLLEAEGYTVIAPKPKKKV